MVLVLISEFMQDEIYLDIESQYYDLFDRVIVFSLRGHMYANKRLQIKNKMEYGAKDIFYKSNKERIKFAIKGMMHPYGRQEMIYLKNSHKLNVSTFKNYLLFTAKAQLLAEKMEEVLEKCKIKNDEKIIFYSYRFGMGVLAAIRIRKRYKNAKIIARCHGQDLFEFRNAENYLPYRNILYKKIDHIFCISEDGKKYIETKYSQYSKKTSVSLLGTSDMGINELLNNKTMIIVSCSRIAPIKRLELIAKALCGIEEFAVKWIHYGEGDLNYLKEIKQILKKCKKNVEYSFEGFVDNEKLRNIYTKEQFSVFINVSESEGLPVSIMEAISVGLPVVATDVGGTREAVIDKYNGFLLKKDFVVSELIEAIQTIHEMNQDEYKLFCTNSRSLWKEKFSESENYRQFVDNILEL